MPADQTPEQPSLRDVLNKLDVVDDQYTKLSKELLPKVQQFESDVRKTGEAHGDLTKQLDAKAQELVKLQTEHKELRKIVEEIEKQAQRPGGYGGKGSPKIVSPGRAFIESEAYKTWLQRGASEIWSKECEIPWNPMRGLPSQLAAKAADFFGDETAGALVDTVYIPGIIDLRKGMPVLRRFMRTVDVPSGKKIVRKKRTAEYMLVTKVATAQTSGNSTLVVESVAGLSDAGDFAKVKVGNEEMTIASGGIDADTNTLTFTANFASNHAKGELVTADQFAFTQEANIAPKTLDVYDDLEVTMGKLMVWTEASGEILEDADLLEDDIQRNLLRKAARNEDKHGFYGNGGTDSLPGMFNNADIPQVLWSNQPTGVSKLDFLLYLNLVVTLAEYMPEVHATSEQDAYDIKKLKGSDGHYIFSQVMTNGMPAKVWATEIVSSTRIKSGDCLSGEFSQAGVLYEHPDAKPTISIGQPNDMFLRDTKALLFRQRLGLGVDHPNALVRGKFDSQP